VCANTQSLTPILSILSPAIALPIGISSKLAHALSLPVQDILVTLNKAEQLYWENLSLIARKGSVLEVRDTLVSLALVQAFQTSLGKSGNVDPRIAAGLLGE
jgi:separase